MPASYTCSNILLERAQREIRSSTLLYPWYYCLYDVLKRISWQTLPDSGVHFPLEQFKKKNVLTLKAH